MRHTLVPEISQGVRRNFGLDSGWYGNFVEDERALDKGELANSSGAIGEGWMTYPHHPRFGSNYRGLTNRLDLLLECYSYLNFEERVRTTYAWLLETLRAAANRADQICELIQASRMPPKRVAIGYTLDKMADPIEVLTRNPRTREGAPHTVTIPHLARFVGTKVVDRPRGYVLPANLRPFLLGHGLRLETAPPSASVEVARLEGVSEQGARAILEASGVGEREVSWKRETRAIAPGSILVPTEQPLGALAVYLCEPESDDGLVSNALLPLPGIGEEFGVVRVVE